MVLLGRFITKLFRLSYSNELRRLLFLLLLFMMVQSISVDLWSRSCHFDRKIPFLLFADLWLRKFLARSFVSGAKLTLGCFFFSFSRGSLVFIKPLDSLTDYYKAHFVPPFIELISLLSNSSGICLLSYFGIFMGSSVLILLNLPVRLLTYECLY